MEPILTLKNVGYRYGQIQAIKGIDLHVYGGEILGILGPNGSGKSTLLKVMDGILVPQEGEILIEDTPFAAFGRSHLAREVAMVAQESHFRFSFSTLEVRVFWLSRSAYLNGWCTMNGAPKHALNVITGSIPSPASVPATFAVYPLMK